MGRTLLVTGRALDRLVEATRRVEAGDYSVRVTPGMPPGRRSRLVDELNVGFDTMTQRLETDERQRRTLLAEISHELRTPLTVVQGNLEAIVDGVYPPDRGAHRADPRGDARPRPADRRPADARAVGGRHADPPHGTDRPGPAGRRGRPLVRARPRPPPESPSDVSIDGDLPITDLDPVRIREVLSNLVANALGHTPPGGRVTVVGGVDPGGWIRLEVRDTGRGIDPELLPHVFDRFVKGDASRGSGLGLAIARQLVTAHGGDIEAESRPGEGTTIRFRLPLRDA